MSGFLQKVLNGKEPLFSASIRRLEARTGNRGIDVRYIAGIGLRAHDVMRAIGLDVRDTKPIELYKALNAHADDNKLFRNTDDVCLFVNGKLISFNQDDVKANIGKTLELRESNHVRCQVQHGLVASYVAAGLDEVEVSEILASAGIKACDFKSYHGKKVDELVGKNKSAQILCIGDIVTDAFIKLRDDQATVSDKNGQKVLSMEFGGKPPYDHVDIISAVGNSANAAVSMSRLGLDASLMAWIGDDEVGRDMKKYLSSEKVDIRPLVTTKGMKSNYHYVLRYGADRTILIKYEDYDYRWREPAKKPDWIYLSAISKSSWNLHRDLVDYLKANEDVKLAFQPGTFHFEWGAEKLKQIYKRTEIVIMNREEAMLVTSSSSRDIKKLAKGIHDLGIKIVVITDGAKGAYASDGERLFRINNCPDPAEPFDRTGAGDAFASTVVAALASGETLETGLLWASISSMSVVQKLGAQAGLLNKKQIHEYIESAPADFKTEEV